MGIHRSGRPSSLVKRVNKKYTLKEANEKKKLILDTLVENKGVITPTLRQCKVSRYYYDIWYNEDDIFKAEIEKLNESTIDWVESKLFQLIEQGDKTCIIFYLKTKGRDRGYIEHQQISQEVSYLEPLTLKIVPPEVKQIEPKEEKKRLE